VLRHRIMMIYTRIALLMLMALTSHVIMPTSARAAAGDHIRLGVFEVVPSLATGMEYHSNVFFEEVDPEVGLAVVANPAISIATKGTGVKVDGSAQWRVNRYIGEESARASNYSDYDVSFGVSSLDGSVFGFSITEFMGKKNSPVASIGAVDPFTSHFQNKVDVKALLSPSGALAFSLGGHVSYDSYLVPDGAQLGGGREYGSKNSFGPTLSADWDFFPRTAIAVEGSMSFIRWDENVIQAGGDFKLGQVLVVPDSDTWRVMGGLRGRITKPIVIELMGGYGAALYDELSAANDMGVVASSDKDPTLVSYGDDLEGWDKFLVNFQVRYNTGLGRKVTLGYKRDFQDVFFTNYVSYDYGFLKFENRIGSRMGLSTQGGVRLEKYGGEVRRDDVRLNAKAGLMYFLKDWGALSTELGWLQRASSDVRVEYDDFRIALGAEFTY
jgi:hypothetical protein